MKKGMVTYANVDITTLIVSVRGQRVVLDRDLAVIYGVPTFRFIAMSNSRRGGRRTLPYAFTEHGALMAANVLRGPREPSRRKSLRVGAKISCPTT